MAKILKANELVRRIREAHAVQLKDKTHPERISYRAKALAFRKRAAVVMQEQKQNETSGS